MRVTQRCEGRFDFVLAHFLYREISVQFVAKCLGGA
jgi:hypothetical protein